MLPLVSKVESTGHRARLFASAIAPDDMGLLNLHRSDSQEKVRNHTQFRNLFYLTGGTGLH